MKPVEWIGSSQKDVEDFPKPVKRQVGYALYLAQLGEKHDKAVPLKGFGGAGVLEVVSSYDGDTYRAVYTVRFGDAIYVLHCFQKKSKSGIATPRQDMELVRKRLATAEEMSKKRRDQS